MKIMHVFVSGFVQGVGYRRFIKNKARKLGLFGYVKNLPDDRVEAVFQGNELELKKMLGICRNGPFLSEVKDMETNYEESEISYNSFDILT